MTYTDDALAALGGPRWNIADAPAHVPDKPGLYAIFGDDEAWTQLGMERRPDDLLYVGKAEDSLVSRELRGHFAIDADTSRADWQQHRPPIFRCAPA
jgi:excinuclease UvrABC nuclease subunit